MGTTDGAMVPMEIEETRSTSSGRNRRGGHTSVRRVPLLLCLTVVPIAFSVVGLSRIVPAADLAYGIEAVTPNDNDATLRPTLPTAHSDAVYSDDLSDEQGGTVVPPHPEPRPTVSTPAPQMGDETSPVDVEPSSPNAAGDALAPAPSLQVDIAVESAPPPQPQPDLPPPEPQPQPEATITSQQAHASEASKSRLPGCSNPPALRSGATWTKEHRAAATHCLTNKTIYFLGNSVTRHWAFTLADILAEGQSAPAKMPPVMYEQQKQKCGRGGKWKGKRPDGGSVVPGADGQCWGLCECSFESVQRADVLDSGSRLVFGWIWDIAHPDVEKSIREGIGDSAPPDIVVYNAGMPQQTCPPCHAGLVEAETGAPALAAMVSRLLASRPELEFYWRSTTAFCGSRKRWNGDAAKLNAKIEAQLCTVPSVRKLDGYAWTLDRCAQYDDDTHHSMLAFDHVTTWIRDVCTMD